MRRFLPFAALGLFLIAGASRAAADPSLVTFRAGRVLQNFGAGFVADSRETVDPDGWRYLSADVKGAIQSLERRYGFQASHGYSKVMRGFAADLTPGQIRALGRDPLIESISVTVSMSASGQTVPWGVRRVFEETGAGVLDGEPLPTAAGPAPGHEVTVYVIDSGIDPKHPDLNVVKRANFTDESPVDCNGHGTHVAGTIGARDNDFGVRGVLPGARLVAVKVVGCAGRGSSAALIKGIDWVAATARLPAVINLSMGGGESPALDRAVQAAASFGIFVVVAAGNEATDACLASPSQSGALSGIVTVAAVDQEDREPDFSNFGGCVDLWAPGVAIESTGRGPDRAPVTLSGTSMAAPHVAGAAALYLRQFPGATPSEVESALVGSSLVPGTASKDGRTILRLRIISP